MLPSTKIFSIHSSFLLKIPNEGDLLFNYQKNLEEFQKQAYYDVLNALYPQSLTSVSFFFISFIRSFYAITLVMFTSCHLRGRNLIETLNKEMKISDDIHKEFERKLNDYPLFIELRGLPICQLCDKVCGNKSSMTTHMKVHKNMTAVAKVATRSLYTA